MTQSVVLLLCVFYISYGKYHKWWATTHFSWSALDVSPDSTEKATTEGTPDEEGAKTADGADATDAAATGDAAAGGF